MVLANGDVEVPPEWTSAVTKDRSATAAARQPSRPERPAREPEQPQPVAHGCRPRVRGTGYSATAHEGPPARARTLKSVWSEAVKPQHSLDSIQASWGSTGIWPPNPKAIDRSIVSKDTRPTSRPRWSVPTRTPELVNEVATPPKGEEKETLAQNTRIDLGPRRVLTHEKCMEVEIEHFRRKIEAAELIMMNVKDAASKKMRAALRIEERNQILAAKRRDPAVAKAATDA
ncbi:hypothetical protein ON010_g11004 [Phytophthora cinnamomi]|nr:hypothetical protein ON010_g11004 [Phytophthora cinnamomi]